MINEELVKRMLLEKPNVKPYVKRDAKTKDIDKIYTIIGPRKAGKTYFLFQLMDELKSTGLPDSQILYINFEDERLSDLRTEDLQRILDIYYELYPENREKEVYFMFDEIQNAPNWSKFVRRLYDKEKCKLYLTGSSAKLLSKEIATELRGRTWSYYIYPFSFREYLKAKGLTVDSNSYYDNNRYRIIRHFEEYLLAGGFPETLNLDDNSRTTLLQGYFDTVMFRDVVDRYHLTNIGIVRDIFRSVANNFARAFSVNKFYNTAKSLNKAVSKDYVYPLADYMEETLYFFFVSIYSESYTLRSINPKKVYMIDNGLIRSVITKPEEDGWFYENLVAIELLRRGYSLNYFADKAESDFIATDPVTKKSKAIQVTLNPNADRELSGLTQAMDRIKAREGILITKSEEKVINKQGKSIKLIPLWKWLLENNSK